MKRIYLGCVVLLAILGVSCKDKPDAGFTYFSVVNGDTTWTPATVNVGDKVYFRSTGKGTNFVVWTGDAAHDYAKKDEFVNADSNTLGSKNSGISLLKVGSYSQSEGYAYPAKGEYSVVFIARQISSFGAESEEDRNSTVKINVRDDNTDVSSFVADSTITVADLTDVKIKASSLNIPARITKDSIITNVQYFFSNYPPFRLYYTFSCGTATATLDGQVLGKNFFVDITPKKDGNLIYIVGTISVTSKEGTVHPYVFAINYAKPLTDPSIKALAVMKNARDLNGIATYNGSKISLEIPAGVSSIIIDSLSLPVGAKIKGPSPKKIVVPVKNPFVRHQFTVIAQDGIATKDYFIEPENVKFQTNEVSDFNFKGYEYLAKEFTQGDTTKVVVTAGKLKANGLYPLFNVESFTKIVAKQVDTTVLVKEEGVPDKLVDKKLDVSLTPTTKLNFERNPTILFEVVNGTKKKYAKVTLIKK